MRPWPLSSRRGRRALRPRQRRPRPRRASSAGWPSPSAASRRPVRRSPPRCRRWWRWRRWRRARPSAPARRRAAPGASGWRRARLVGDCHVAAIAAAAGCCRPAASRGSARPCLPSHRGSAVATSGSRLSERGHRRSEDRRDPRGGDLCRRSRRLELHVCGGDLDPGAAGLDRRPCADVPLFWWRSAADRARQSASGVNRACYYDPAINRSYGHDGVALLRRRPAGAAAQAARQGAGRREHVGLGHHNARNAPISTSPPRDWITRAATRWPRRDASIGRAPPSRAAR